MKLARLVLILAIFSLGIAAIFYSTNDLIIKSTWYGKLTEIVVMAVPIFVVLLFVYYLGRTMAKTAARVRKKSLPK